MPEPEITELLRAAREGDDRAMGQLMPMLYGELRRLAASQMKGERSDHTLQPTALVHDAYLRLVKMEMPFVDRHHFFAMAATTMRRVLVEYARARNREKRGGDLLQVPLTGLELGAPDVDADLLGLDEALERLSKEDPRRGEVVELFYFGGLTTAEIARGVGVSEPTVKRDLRFARAWLLDFMDPPEDSV